MFISNRKRMMVQGVGDAMQWYSDGDISSLDNLLGTTTSQTSPGVIQLLDGRQVSASSITFNSGTYHFLMAGEDVTNLITRQDKQNNWPGFDPAVDNDRLYRQQTIAATGKDPGPPLETSTLTLFGQNVSKDIQQNFGVSALKTDFKDLLFFAAIGLGIYFAIEKKLL